MNKKIVVISIVFIIITISTIGFLINQIGEKHDNTIFHVTLANPDLYKNGVYSNSFIVDKGEYVFKFVPNGDSPKFLAISLNGTDYNFSEKFELKGTLHETGISEYYTWEYDGKKEIQIPMHQEITIAINPNGNELGSVSVNIIKN